MERMLASTRGWPASGFEYGLPATLAGSSTAEPRSLSASFREVDHSPAFWRAVAAISGSAISGEWLEFVRETQNATPVAAELRHGSDCLGFFTGLIVKKCGLRILGSPFPGWMTPYMGITLNPGVSRSLALIALERFAFEDLGCAHVEIVDRALSPQDVQGTGYTYTIVQSYETDLTAPEDRLFATMKSACRRCIRKAKRSGVVIEEAQHQDADFVGEYYAQLTEGLLAKRIVPSYNEVLVRKLVEHLGPSGRLLLLRARDSQGRCIASGIYPATNTTAHIWGNVASYPRSRHVRPVESLNWYAMRYWKAHGLESFDWGGLGRYKEKYGGTLITLLRVRKSRSKTISLLRQVAETTLRRSLRLQGCVAAWRKPIS